jgi:hypothetical protein
VSRPPSAETGAALPTSPLVEPPIVVGATATLEGAERTAELERRAAEAGRGHIPVSVYAVPGDREVVARLIDAGVDRILLDLPTLPEEETYRALDELASAVQAFPR